MLKNKTVLVGVSASIACYKACSLVSLLVKAGADVHVLMTKNSLNFVNPITFETLTKNKCLTDTFDRSFEFNVEHVSLAKKADLFIAAPATANVISKLANGLADDMLTTTFLACDCPKLIAPAMNTAMYENKITQDNLKKCRDYGMKIIEPATGILACGDEGRGKLAEPEILFEHILNEIQFEKDLKGKRFLITAGPTQEPLDPVRYITNHSTGKMGYAIVKNASLRGATVDLISGPVNLKEPLFINVHHVKSAKEMAQKVFELSENADAIIKAAAVADYTPKNFSENKIKKSDGEFKIELERTTDILKHLGEHRPKNKKQVICGFSMETENLIENSRAKLEKKNLDLICANSLKTKGAGFGSDTNVVTIISKNSTQELELMSKDDVAKILLDAIKEML